MYITTINEIPGKKISETLGIARGSTVRTRNVGKDIFAAFKNLIGGEVKAYTNSGVSGDYLSEEIWASIQFEVSMISPFLYFFLKMF